ncbi:MAG TPA: hypothetical protein VFB92_04125 [Vicinamibacterales bacterium]|nr:hypothetical protein [Vicinamibacterales bacterium]
MPDEVTRRREQQLEFARRRIAERGDYSDPERGDYSDPERGGFGQRAGTSQSQVAADILRRAVGLGGHLVVAFVSPVGASTASCPRFRRSRPSELTTAGASARVAEMIQIKMLREGRLQKKPSARPAGQKPAKPTGQ